MPYFPLLRVRERRTLPGKGGRIGAAPFPLMGRQVAATRLRTPLTKLPMRRPPHQVQKTRGSPAVVPQRPDGVGDEIAEPADTVAAFGFLVIGKLAGNLAEKLGRALDEVPGVNAKPAVGEMVEEPASPLPVAFAHPDGHAEVRDPIGAAFVVSRPGGLEEPKPLSSLPGRVVETGSGVVVAVRPPLGAEGRLKVAVDEGSERVGADANRMVRQSEGVIPREPGGTTAGLFADDRRSLGGAPSLGMLRPLILHDTDRVDSPHESGRGPMTMPDSAEYDAGSGGDPGMTRVQPDGEIRTERAVQVTGSSVRYLVSTLSAATPERVNMGDSPREMAASEGPHARKEVLVTAAASERAEADGVVELSHDQGFAGKTPTGVYPELRPTESAGAEGVETKGERGLPDQETLAGRTLATGSASGFGPDSQGVGPMRWGRATVPPTGTELQSVGLSVAVDSPSGQPLAPLATGPGDRASARQAERIVHQLAPALRILPDGVAELNLSPEELGRLRLSMVSDGDSMVVHVAADRPDTLDLLRRHVDLLGNALREAGFSDVDCSFSGNGRDALPMPPTQESGEDPGLTEDVPGPATPARPATDKRLDLRL